MGLHHGVSPMTFFYVHNISLYISNFFQINKQNLSVHNTDTSFYTKIQTNRDSLFSLHLCIFKSTFFSYINNFFSKTNFYLYITQILFENTFTEKLRSFVFYLYIYT